MNKNYSNDNLNYSFSGNLENTTSVSNSEVTWGVSNVYDYYHHYYWPTFYPTIHYEESKVDKAFKIAKRLIDMKILKGELTVGKFIELVNEISKDL
jgi:hypothetical protein